MVRAFAHGVIGRRIDPSYTTWLHCKIQNRADRLESENMTWYLLVGNNLLNPNSNLKSNIKKVLGRLPTGVQ